MVDCDTQSLIYLINFYANFGWVYSAQNVFTEMSEQNVVSWLTFIQGFLTSNTYGLHCCVFQIKFCAKSGFLNSAHQVFAKLCEQGVFSLTVITIGFVARVNCWSRKQVFPACLLPRVFSIS
ncbi:hypothetical protein RYX36_024836 [Vicia faba]